MLLAVTLLCLVGSASAAWDQLRTPNLPTYTKAYKEAAQRAYQSEESKQARYKAQEIRAVELINAVDELDKLFSEDDPKHKNLLPAHCQNRVRSQNQTALCGGRSPSASVASAGSRSAGSSPASCSPGSPSCSDGDSYARVQRERRKRRKQRNTIKRAMQDLKEEHKKGFEEGLHTGFVEAFKMMKEVAPEAYKAVLAMRKKPEISRADEILGCRVKRIIRRRLMDRLHISERNGHAC